MTIRNHIYLTGHVQGVGLRFTCIYKAKEIALTGWIKNLCDGRVELELQGEEIEIDAFLNMIEGQFEIHKLERNKIPTILNEQSFDLGW